MKLNTMADLRAAILKEKRNIKISDIASSRCFKKFILSGVEALFRIYDMRNPIDFNVFYDPNNELTGCTDNKKCIINAGHPLFTMNNKGEFVSVQIAYNRILGVLFHEMGHILYTDTQYRKKEMETIARDKVFLEPLNLPLEYRKDYEAIYEAVKNNATFRGLVGKMIMTFSNIIEDGRIERKLLTECASASGFCRGLKVLREFQFENTNFAKEIEDMRMNGVYEFQILPNLMLWYAKFACKHETYEDGSFLLFEKAMPYIDDYMTEGKNSRELYDNIRMIIIISWRFGLSDILKDIEEAQENMQNNNDGDSQGENQGDSQDNDNCQSQNTGSSQSEGSDDENNNSASSNGSLGCGVSIGEGKSMSEEGDKPLTKEEVKEIIENIIKQLEESKQTEDTKYEGSGEANKKTANELPITESNSLDKIMEEATEEKIRSEVEQELGNSIRNIVVENASGYKNITVFSKADIEDISSSECTISASELKRELFYPVRKTAREINRHIVSDQRTGKQISFTGQKFKASKAYKGDLKYFEKKGQKVDTKRLAVAVRVDESGSMASNKRYEYAKKATAMLYMLSEEVETLDVAIYGDTANSYTFACIPYCDFGLKPKNALELLSKMCPKSRNDDAMALKILGEKLLKQDADERILISISDGLPSECTSDELKEVVSHYAKKGVNVIAMAIGDDKESIAKLYGKDRFCNIENLEDLPKILTNLIKRKL